MESIFYRDELPINCRFLFYYFSNKNGLSQKPFSWKEVSIFGFNSATFHRCLHKLLSLNWLDKTITYQNKVLYKINPNMRPYIGKQLLYEKQQNSHFESSTGKQQNSHFESSTGKQQITVHFLECMQTFWLDLSQKVINLIKSYQQVINSFYHFGKKKLLWRSWGALGLDFFSKKNLIIFSYLHLMALILSKSTLQILI